MLTIARTLMGNPDVLLIDEPTEGLDPLMFNDVRNVLAEFNRAGVSVLLAEHKSESGAFTCSPDRGLTTGLRAEITT